MSSFNKVTSLFYIRNKVTCHSDTSPNDIPLQLRSVISLSMETQTYRCIFWSSRRWIFSTVDSRYLPAWCVVLFQEDVLPLYFVGRVTFAILFFYNRLPCGCLVAMDDMESNLMFSSNNGKCFQYGVVSYSISTSRICSKNVGFIVLCNHVTKPSWNFVRCT